MATRERQQVAVDGSQTDPQPITKFAGVAEIGLLQLRCYTPESPQPGLPPVLLLYPPIKRPFILDLLPDRSVVRSLLRSGFRVYMTDWISPRGDDSDLGLDAYVEHDLAMAVDEICRREEVSSIAVAGICCGGVLAAIHAALHPDRVSHLVTLATPFETDPPVAPLLAEQIVFAWRNVPAWMVGSVMNARMQDSFHIAFQLAKDLGEPELAGAAPQDSIDLVSAFIPWLASDVPVAGRLFLEVVENVLPDSNLLEGRLRVGGNQVDLANISCPVLVIAGERDALVPPSCTTRFTEIAGDGDNRQIIFPTGHLGLMLSRAAHTRLWPDVADWISGRNSQPMDRTA